MLGVIFDMDGTLLDTQRIFIDAWDAVGLNYGIKNLGQHIPFVSGMSETGWKQYLREHFPTLNVDAFQKDMVDFVARNLTLRYKPGAEALMDFLQAHHIPMAVASGTDRAIVDHHLSTLGALTRFAAIVGGDEVPNSKPAPDVFLLAAEKMGLAPADCIVFEDSVNGILAGHAAGMKCIGVPDIAAFPKDVKGLLMAELPSLDKAIDLLKAHQ